MNSRQKITLAAALLLLLVLGVLFWPSAQKSENSSAVSDRTRVADHATRASDRSAGASSRSSLPRTSRPIRDFPTLVKLAEEGNFPKLSREEIDRYLLAESRSAAALLTAFRLSEDEALLREAMEKFPSNPQVQLASLRLFSDPAERLKVLESLKNSDPTNGIVDCLAAVALFESGKDKEALAALSQSAGKPIRDYTLLSCQNDEEACLGAGLPSLEAKLSAVMQSKPLVLQVLRLEKVLKKQRASDEAAGDDAAVQSSRELQLQMAGQLGQGGLLIDQTIALAMEKGVLKEEDSPEARTRIEDLERERKSISERAQYVDKLMKSSTVPEPEWVHYFDRVKLFGEKTAMDWLLERHPQP